MKHQNRLKHLVMTAMLSALCCVTTFMIQIPLPTGGYLHLGDAMVLLCGWLLGPLWGGMAAGLGSMLADVFSGYIIYAPATFVLKAAVAVVGWLLWRLFTRILPKHTWFSLIAGGFFAELIMVAGYFMFEAWMIGYGWGAAVNIPGNAFQALFGILVGSVFMKMLGRLHLREGFWTREHL